MPPQQLKIVPIEGKGEGVITTAPISQGDYICEYEGKLISDEGRPERKKGPWPPRIDDWTSAGNFSFFFRDLDGTRFCVDANEASSIGKKINHDSKGGNLIPRLRKQEDGKAVAIEFVARHDISAMSEITYDYHDRANAGAFPFLG